MALIRSTLLSL